MENQENKTVTLPNGKTITIPLIPLIPVPFINMDEVNTDFDMDVTTSSSNDDNGEIDKENMD